MEDATLSNDAYSQITKGGMIHVLIACLVLFVVACSDSSTSTTETSADQDKMLSTEVTPHTILNGGDISGIPNKAPNSQPTLAQGMNGNGFAGPLFDLATAPNGDILVADAGAGVATIDGATEIPLPGISNMSPIGRRAMWAIEGLMGAPGDDTGQALYRLSKGNTTMIADLFDFEEEYNPDGETPFDSNPFSVQSLGGQATLVVDAGGNDLLRIDNQGNIEVLAVFPDEVVPTDNIKKLFGCPEGPPTICELPPVGLPPEIPAQPVPTSVAIGPDGYYYVGELKGFPAPADASNIWKIAPDASWAECGSSPDCQKVFDGGFTSIMDLAFDSNGNLHVAEIDEQSWLAVEVLAPTDLIGGTINTCDLDAVSCTEVATGIPALTAIAFGNNGALWATKNALNPNSSEVIAVTNP